MKAHLLYRDRDFDTDRTLPENEPALTSDLALDTLFEAMAGGDGFLLSVARQAVFSGLEDDLSTVLYRQAVLKDCLKNPDAVRAFYDLAVEAIEAKKKQWLGIFTHYPAGILHGAVDLMRLFVERLRKLRLLAETHAGSFESEGFTTLFALLRKELADDYLAEVEDCLRELRLEDGVLISASLGRGNQGVGYVLRKPSGGRTGWLRRLLARRPPGYTFTIAERDDAGAHALSDLRDRGLNVAANALAQSADHLQAFFVMLRTELAFYLGGLNLHRALVRAGAEVCFPVPAAAPERRHAAAGLRDAALVLRQGGGVTANDLAGDGKSLVIITGANQGGKSTFLRGIGVAQLMMQCGLFVAARSFEGNLCRGLFTHSKREEDATLKSGKFDEELARMSGIADALGPDSLVLFNESFAATNEREGSEIARQVVHALLEARVKVFFVTHQYELAHGFWAEGRPDALFLRAERREGGTRTFRLPPGEPLQTSFGADLYREIFGDEENGPEA